MMLVLPLVALGVLIVIVRARRARKATLSGLNGDRPVFSSDPPTRRLSPRKGERL